jgi:nucleotide-binding universal stress UspA family protein
MIKDVVVNLSIGAARDVTADYAVSVAAAFEAHIAGIAFAYEPVIAPAVMGSIPAEYIDQQRAESRKAADAAVAYFEEAARREALSAGHRVIPATLAGAADAFGRIARRFDISVVAQAEPGALAPQELLIEGALFESGRPMIVVPYIQKEPLKLDRVMVCWDSSRTAARAIGDALPLLARAKTVEVVIVTSARGHSDEIPGADLGEHLAHHGLTVEVKRIVSADLDVANTLLSHAADTSADFMIMGGYGHSRLREFVLGGATRDILQSMTVPTLMSH